MANQAPGSARGVLDPADKLLGMFDQQDVNVAPLPKDFRFGQVPDVNIHGGNRLDTQQPCLNACLEQKALQEGVAQTVSLSGIHQPGEKIGVPYLLSYDA